MTNNTPDYNDNLAFEPEMTWEDLIEWVRKCREEYNDFNVYICDEDIYAKNLTFCSDGHIYVDESCLGDEITVIPCVTSERTPRQMQTIIKALYE